MPAHVQHITAYSWPEFQNLPMAQKVRCLAREDGTPFHTLFAQQFDRANLDRLCKLATEIRTIAKSRSGMLFLQSLLSHKRAMLYFTQPSSRTFLSFISACQILGLHTGEVRDTSTSSEFKGESQEDSIRTFSSYFDLIVMRTQEKGLAEHMAWTLSNSERPVPIVNAGSGKDQHPTQALLDIYTLNRSFERRGGLRNRAVMFVGDLARGRTASIDADDVTDARRAFDLIVAADADTVCVLHHGYLVGTLSQRTALRQTLYRPAVDADGRLIVAAAFPTARCNASSRWSASVPAAACSYSFASSRMSWRYSRESQSFMPRMAPARTRLQTRSRSSRRGWAFKVSRKSARASRRLRWTSGDRFGLSPK